MLELVYNKRRPLAWNMSLAGDLGAVISLTDEIIRSQGLQRQ